MWWIFKYIILYHYNEQQWTEKERDRTLQNFKRVLDHGVLDFLETRDFYNWEE